jgi:hypothetical protein
MPKFKVRLICPVELTASTEVTVEAEDAEQAGDAAIEKLKQLDEEYQTALANYRKNRGDYPTPAYFWTVDQDDVDGAIDEEDIEYSDVEDV